MVEKVSLVQNILKKEAICCWDSQFFHSTYFSCQRESANEGTLAPKYLEAMAILDRTQEKLM